MYATGLHNIPLDSTDCHGVSMEIHGVFMEVSYAFAHVTCKFHGVFHMDLMGYKISIFIIICFVLLSYYFLCCITVFSSLDDEIKNRKPGPLLCKIAAASPVSSETGGVYFLAHPIV